jgi:hypothetical protein
VGECDAGRRQFVRNRRPQTPSIVRRLLRERLESALLRDAARADHRPLNARSTCSASCIVIAKVFENRPPAPRLVLLAAEIKASNSFDYLVMSSDCASFATVAPKISRILLAI